MEGMDPRDELIRDQRDSLILARERIAKLEMRLERYKEANLRLDRENEQYEATLKMYIDRERDRNRMNSEWMEEDQTGTEINTNFRYDEPYSIGSQDLERRRPQILNFLSTAQDSEAGSAHGPLPRRERNLHGIPRFEPYNPSQRPSYVRMRTPERNPTGSSCSDTSRTDPTRPRSDIPSLFDLKLQAPAGLRNETLHWLKEDARAGCWNCGSTGHCYQDCMEGNRAIFCHGCGEPGVRTRSCPFCRKDDQPILNPLMTQNFPEQWNPYP
ncbi:uncharacterized protein LOC117167382 [Belonocnema kinseyi]|uniref:uncharacterized protein LOC117167382 n=1 Tax=Belonocnema kinseyi TaxID=2817044 RepID=UPI00143CD1A9|nr:uncharacterized protein LOC117167382 [Belonocnema kinseyi]